jgi:dihydropteroate synthase
MSDRKYEWRLLDRVLRLGPRPLVMGILNVTPDSFSDGGHFADTDTAVERGLALIAEGADILDIGGESSRPGAQGIPEEEELRRVLPVVRALAAQTTVPISVDTTKAAVARSCLSAGAKIINDITALAGDADMPQVVGETRAGVIAMHMQGTPPTMQLAPHYADVVGDIMQFLEARLQHLEDQGIAREQVVLDPGIGFGKTATHNLELLARLEEFQRLGRPICLGVSRKGFLGRTLNRPVTERLAGSLAAIVYAMSRNAVQVLRVHDVAATRDAVIVVDAIQRGESREIGKTPGANL